MLLCVLQQGLSALSMACSRGHKDIALLLLAENATEILCTRGRVRVSISAFLVELKLRSYLSPYWLLLLISFTVVVVVVVVVVVGRRSPLLCTGPVAGDGKMW